MNTQIEWDMYQADLAIWRVDPEFAMSLGIIDEPEPPYKTKHITVERGTVDMMTSGSIRTPITASTESISLDLANPYITMYNDYMHRAKMFHGEII